MKVIDRGSGPALVLIPGLQGRWEYMRATVDALAESFRVITFSLGSGDLDTLAGQVIAALDQKEIDRAAVCGVSFGGLVAARTAAAYPERVGSLILASTPRPALTLRRRHEIYLTAPWFFGLLFLAETPLRLRHEVRTAIPNRRERRRFALNALRTFCVAPPSPSRMAARARLVAGSTLAADCGRITSPTLVVTGEAHLDYVVPVEGSSEYLRLIPNARGTVLRHTGHIGTMTRPSTFAALVRAFVEGRHHAAA